MTNLMGNLSKGSLYICIWGAHAVVRKKRDKHTLSNPQGKYSCAACLAHSTKDTLHASQSQDPGGKITVWHRATQHGNVCPA